MSIVDYEGHGHCIRKYSKQRLWHVLRTDSELIKAIREGKINVSDYARYAYERVTGEKAPTHNPNAKTLITIKEKPKQKIKKDLESEIEEITIPCED